MVWTWGNNDVGQLGDGTTKGRNIPSQLITIREVIDIAGGPGPGPQAYINGNGPFWHEHSVALKSDGTVWAWGSNFVGALGISSKNIDNSVIPVKMKISDAVAIAAGYAYSMTLKSDGTVWSCGVFTWIDSMCGYITPEQIEGLYRIIAIGGGWYHKLALKRDRTVWTWGKNNYGQLGNGTFMESVTYESTPQRVRSIRGIIAIAGGANHSLALKYNGTVWAWGDNQYGQLGDGTTVGRNTPAQVSELSNVIAIAGGADHSLALKSDGTVWAWGRNLYGQLGDGTYIDKHVPTQVLGLNEVFAIGCGASHSFAIGSDSSIYAWGDNRYGQLGDGTTVDDRNTPIRIKDLTFTQNE